MFHPSGLGRGAFKGLHHGVLAMRCTARRVVHLAALILGLWAVIASLPQAHAYGQVPTGAYPQKRWYTAPCTSESALGGAACNAARTIGTTVSDISNCSITFEDAMSANTRCIYTPNGNVLINGVTATMVNIAGSCPANALLSSLGSCICNYGRKPDGTQCSPAACGAVGTYSSSTQADFQVFTADTRQCQGGCSVAVSKVSVGPDGKMWAQWPYLSLGDTPSAWCGGLPAANGVPSPVDLSGTTIGEQAPIPCKAGTSPGTVNGAAVCVASSSTITSKDRVDPAGAITQELTKCANGACSTTTKNADGSSGGTVVGMSGVLLPGAAGAGGVAGAAGTDPMKPFCTENPTSIICKTSAISGTCEAVACDGDAVQCAIAREQAKRNCELMDKVTPLSTIGTEATAAGDRPSTHPGAAANVQALGLPALSDAPLFGSAGGCPADVSIPLGARSVVIPFSSMCASLAMIGLALKGLAYFAAAFIVFRRGS